MKKLFLLFILVLLIACGPVDQEELIDDVQEEVEELLESRCDSYTTDYIKKSCYAQEAVDLSMCSEVSVSRYKEECVVVIAELSQDQSQLSDCSISDVDVNRILCQALIKKDIDHCFTMDEGYGNSLSIRDCITLVSRKSRSLDLCQYFSSHSSQLMQKCGQSGDCEGQWIYGIEDNIESCQYSVQTAIDYELENS